MRCASLAAASIILTAAGAQAQDRWTTGFRQGFSVATLAVARGPMLQLSCDTGGAKPGRGAITIELRTPKGSIAAPTSPTDIVVTGAGQTIRLKASAAIAPARDPAPAPARRRTREAPIETRPSATEDAVTLTYDLDGSASAAQPMAGLAAAIAREPREIVIPAPALGLDAKLPSRQAAQAMRGFDKGCQDALPPDDDEMQWDWQQGLDRIDDKLQVTLAAAADDAGSDAPKLMLRCASGPLQALVTGWRRRTPAGAPDDDQVALTIESGAGDTMQATWVGKRADNGAWTIEGETAARFIASIWRGARITLASPRVDAAGGRISFPIAGVPLATRKLIETCPTPLLPPKD